MAFPTCKVSITLLSPDGDPIQGAIAVSLLSSRLVYDGIVLKEEVSGESDANGIITLDLFPNVLVINPETYYEVLIGTPSGQIEKYNIKVPNQPTANLRDLIITELPDGAGDRLEQLLLELKKIEFEVKDAAAKVATNTATVESDTKKVEAFANSAEASATSASSSLSALQIAINKALNDIKTYKTEAEQSAKDASVSKISAEISASDATTKQIDTNNLYQKTDGIKRDVENIYQQILASVKPDGQSHIGHLVVSASYIYNAVANQEKFEGPDVNNHVLTYELGQVILYHNGILLVPNRDYVANDTRSIQLVKPIQKDDVVTIFSLTASNDGGGGGGDIDYDLITPLKCSNLARYLKPSIDDIVITPTSGSNLMKVLHIMPDTVLLLHDDNFNITTATIGIAPNFLDDNHIVELFVAFVGEGGAGGVASNSVTGRGGAGAEVITGRLGLKQDITIDNSIRVRIDKRADKDRLTSYVLNVSIGNRIYLIDQSNNMNSSNSNVNLSPTNGISGEAANPDLPLVTPDNRRNNNFNYIEGGKGGVLSKKQFNAGTGGGAAGGNDGVGRNNANTGGQGGSGFSGGGGGAGTIQGSGGASVGYIYTGETTGDHSLVNSGGDGANPGGGAGGGESPGKGGECGIIIKMIGIRTIS